MHAAQTLANVSCICSNGLEESKRLGERNIHTRDIAVVADS